MLLSSLINLLLRYKHEVRTNAYQVGSRSMINLGTMVTLLLIAVVGCSFLLFFQRYTSTNHDLCFIQYDPYSFRIGRRHLSILFHTVGPVQF